MLGVVLNETEIVDKFKSDYIIESKPMNIVGLLLKKYYLDKMDKESIRKQIMEDLERSFGKDFVYTKWDTPIKNYVNKFHKNISLYKTEVKMNDIKEILITKGELDKIKELNNLILEKMAFIMLVYAKISNIQMQNKEGWINKIPNIICREAKVSLKGIDQKKALHELYKNEYIIMSSNNSKVSMKINYIEETSEVEIIINDFEGIIYQYLIWKGEKWKRCQCCNKWVKLKTPNSKQKYCTKCAKEIDNINRNQRKR